MPSYIFWPDTLLLRRKASAAGPQEGISEYPTTCFRVRSLMENNVGSSWPSLYNPAKEILSFKHGPPTHAHYLYHPNGEFNTRLLHVYRIFLCSEIFRFTLYWTLIFSLPLYFISGIFAFFNITFPPSRRSTPFSYPETGYENTVHRVTPRSRLTFSILVLLLFLTLSLLNAVIGAAVVGYVLAGLFRAAGFNMSTCVSPAFSL